MGARGRIFISYRRGDVPGDARGVCDRLERKFGKANVFMDVDRLLAGQRFDRELDKALSQCDVLIAVIGPRWMGLLSEHVHSGERDFVHDEIAAALKRDIVVIPALIGHEGQMPSLPQRNDLPENIRDLVLYQKHDIAHESFKRDADHLTAAISSLLRGESPAWPWRPIAVSGAIGLVVTTAMLGFLMNAVPRIVPSGPQPYQGTDGGKVVAQLNSSGDHSVSVTSPEITEKKAIDQDIARKKADEVTKLAIIGDATAMNSLGFLYENGQGVSQNYTEARKWYEKAANSGNAAAMTNLGYLYDNGGLGVNQDFAEARKWYEKAAALGNTHAMVNLGLLFDNGFGVTKDREQARTWYRKAADAGDQDAEKLLRKFK